jgi:hypothetical protein
MGVSLVWLPCWKPKMLKWNIYGTSIISCLIFMARVPSDMVHLRSSPAKCKILDRFDCQELWSRNEPDARAAYRCHQIDHIPSAPTSTNIMPFRYIHPQQKTLLPTIKRTVPILLLWPIWAHAPCIEPWRTNEEPMKNYHDHGDVTSHDAMAPPPTRSRWSSILHLAVRVLILYGVNLRRTWGTGLSAFFFQFASQVNHNNIVHFWDIFCAEFLRSSFSACVKCWMTQECPMNVFWLYAGHGDKPVIGPWLDTRNFACFWLCSLLKLLFLCNSTCSW